MGNSLHFSQHSKSSGRLIAAFLSFFFVSTFFLPFEADFLASLLRDDSRRRMKIPMVIGRFKMNTAKRINQIRDTPGLPVWQRNYYEHIIRSEKEYLQIEAYIENNPANWVADNENV